MGEIVTFAVRMRNGGALTWLPSGDRPVNLTYKWLDANRQVVVSEMDYEKAVDSLSSYGPVALGGNCGNGPDEIIEVIEKMHVADPQLLLVAKANAGVPELVKGKPVYRASPERMAEYAIQSYQAGARIIGGCCGSTPAHIRSIAQALAKHTQS